MEAEVGGVPLHLAGIFSAVEDVAADRECIVWGDRCWTWAETGDRARRVASALAGRGLGLRRDLDECAPWESPHDHVALYLHNGNEYLEVMLGSYMARCAPVNVNYRYRAEELAYVLGDSDSRVVIYHATFAPRLAEVLPRLGSVELLVHVEDDSGNEPLAGAVPYEELLRGANPALPAELVDTWSGDDLYVCYTGGTTGNPKGVLWRQDDFLRAALGIGRRDGSPFADLAELAAAARTSTLRALPAPPLMHGAAHWNAMSCWAAGGTIILQDDTTRLHPADLWRSVERHGATSLLIVGDPFARPLLDEWDHATSIGRSYKCDHLRHLISGGAVLSPQIKLALLERLPHLRIVDVLGSTESGRQGLDTSRRASTTTGFSASGNATVLDDDMRTELEAGDPRIGWLAQRGRVPRGYLGDRDKTERTFPEIGGVAVAVAGDRARRLADGTIELLGRDSAVINTGGEKVFAEEVETRLKAHPAVFDAVVCGRPSPRWGEEVVAVVELRAGVSVDDDDLRGWCRSRLADFKVPKGIVRVERVRRSPSGKADYRWARSEATSQE